MGDTICEALELRLKLLGIVLPLVVLGNEFLTAVIQLGCPVVSLSGRDVSRLIKEAVDKFVELAEERGQPFVVLDIVRGL